MTLLFKQYWGQAVQFGITVAGVVFSFVSVPNFMDYEAEKFIKYGQYLAASIFLILLIPFSKFQKLKHQKFWWSTAVLLFVLSLIVLLRYTVDFQDKTIKYQSYRIIIADENEMIPAAKSQKDKIEKELNRPVPIEECVFLNAGQVKDLWPRSVLRYNRLLISIEYMLVIILITSFCLTIIQALKCQ